MATTTTGVFVDGVVRLDDTIDMPNHSRVTVQIEAIDVDPSARIDAWNRLQKFLTDNQINSGGQKFSRDELYDCG